MSAVEQLAKLLEASGAEAVFRHSDVNEAFSVLRAELKAAQLNNDRLNDRLKAERDVTAKTYGKLHVVLKATQEGLDASRKQAQDFEQELERHATDRVNQRRELGRLRKALKRFCTCTPGKFEGTCTACRALNGVADVQEEVAE